MDPFVPIKTNQWWPGRGMENSARILITRPFAVRKMRGKERDPLWASVLLARMKAPDTLRLVRANVWAEADRQRLRDYFYALALLGSDEAYAFLKHYADRGKGNRQIMAAQMLERYPKPGDAARELAR